MVVVYVESFAFELGPFETTVQDPLLTILRYFKGPQAVLPHQLRRVPNGKRANLEDIEADDDSAYILDEPGWQKHMRELILQGRSSMAPQLERGAVSESSEEEEQKEDVSKMDLPKSVITSIEELTETEFRPSIFGGIPDHLLIQGKAVNAADVDDLKWVKVALRKGIAFSKCSRKMLVEPRILQSNPTFTVFECRPKDDSSIKKFKFGSSIKKFATSDIVTIVKGKASKELEQTSSSISAHSCLCLAFTNRSLSMVLPSMQERDRICRGLASLLGKPVVEQDDIL